MPRPHPPEFRQRAIELARLGDKPIVTALAAITPTERQRILAVLKMLGVTSLEGAWVDTEQLPEAARRLAGT